MFSAEERISGACDCVFNVIRKKSWFVIVSVWREEYPVRVRVIVFSKWSEKVSGLFHVSVRREEHPVCGDEQLAAVDGEAPRKVRPEGVHVQAEGLQK